MPPVRTQAEIAFLMASRERRPKKKDKKTGRESSDPLDAGTFTLVPPLSKPVMMQPEPVLQMHDLMNMTPPQETSVFVNTQQLTEMAARDMMDSIQVDV